MKLSKTEVRCSTSTIPELRFEDQALTSFSGLVIIQKLVQQLALKERLRSCVRHLHPATSYHPATILLLLVTHLVIGWRRLRDLDYFETCGSRRRPKQRTDPIDDSGIHRSQRARHGSSPPDIVAVLT